MEVTTYITYALAAAWWYNRHRHWPYQMEAIVLAILVGMGISWALKAGHEAIWRNTIPWSIFSGLMASAVMDRRKFRRGDNSSCV